MKAALVWMGLTCVAAAAWAGDAVPGGIVYQGILSDPVEGALTGTQQATFRVFMDAAGGDAMWSTNLDVWCSAAGAFHAWLEGGDGLVDAFAEAQRFLEVQVEGHGGAIAPRVAFTSVPQALMSRWARQSPLTFAVTGALSVSNEVAVADAAKFGAGARFGGDLSVERDAEWQDESAVVEVSGAVTALKFEGDGIAPVGSIAMWGSTNIPVGWMPCDGQDGRPDLRDLFLVGVGGEENYRCGQTGGTNAVPLTVAEMPAHTHEYATASDRSYHYGVVGWNTKHDDWWQNSREGKCQSGTTGPCGNGKAHENRPPYYALMFIMRVQ